MAFAGAITACVAYSMTKFFPLMANDDSIFMVFPKFCLITGVSFIAYFLAGYFLDLEQVRPLAQKLKRALYRNLK